MRIAFLHGWSGDRALWSQLIPQLRDFTCLADDRGYFGAPAVVPAADIVVAHSFGTLRALARPPAGARALVAINGFDCFAARPDFPHGVAPRVLARMADRLAVDPAGTVAAFRARCGALPPDRAPEPVPLAEDLARLRGDDLRGRWTGPLVVIHGARDPIVPPALQAATFADRPDAIRLTLPDHGHLAPLTAALSCAGAIRALAARLG
ncbi:alpha/beta fold hydrolase [Novosphingobium piscinae]|uniref:Alpha/beta hydrolase n=1 Tax=Novosphingobium piscinae TaxID=1507448 RepID=A0A7X1KR61_9SPHN|nr:alpha/beta hydrolase [Novosphingobium piscinae]MBC2670377.1 alpha/beta hydrolase [Novosphingobium piscinae]